ncbi:probable E3 ubiquitin-protein ligase RHC1A [Typha angustifolia]|uniref:probable E3 ubiquitin-protein ligase RHC1A n=1 Tax=Typha angustifolia TaxID=59011 RepID=UPI003C2F201D
MPSNVAGRTCRLFWCYECRSATRIISSPSSEVFCPRCSGRFLLEIDFPRPALSPEVISLPCIRFHPSRSQNAFDNLPRRRLPTPPIPTPPMERSIPPTVTTEDYFTGPNLNNLIEELTQNDRPGPPPAPPSTIAAMPTVLVSEAHLTDGSQCPVCKEEFELGEEAREMPCKHVYHSDCIVPWLSIHNSCPVCRFQLPGGRDGSRNQDGNVEREPNRPRWNPFALLRPRRDYGSGNDEGDDDLMVLRTFVLVSVCFAVVSFLI